jgi:hypothetical protein
VTIVPAGALIAPNGNGALADRFRSRVTVDGASSVLGTGDRDATGKSGFGQFLVTAGATITALGSALETHGTEPQVTNAGTRAGARGVFCSAVPGSNTPTDDRIGNSRDILGGRLDPAGAGGGTILLQGLLTSLFDGADVIP